MATKSTSRISALASILISATAEFDAVASSEQLPSPSFDVDFPGKALFHPKITALRQAILDATDELHALMLGPVGILNPSPNALTSLHAICRLNLVESIPIDQPEVSLGEISASSKLNEDTVARLLRHASANYVFREPHRGYFAHTGASHMLATNHGIRQWIEMVSEELWPAATKVFGALDKWPNSEEPTQTGWNLAHDTELTIFNELATRSRERQERYSEAMSWMNTGPGLEPNYVVDQSLWSSVKTVVDVGGAHGNVSVALARRYPSIHCIVQDQPEVISEGRKRLDPDLEPQVTFMAHDFFADQPLRNVDVFYLRWILHDWSDKYAVRILRSLIPALTTRSRVLVSEMILSEPGTVSPYQDRHLRNFDISMMEFHNGKERDAADWRKLFHKADPRFEVLKITQPPGSRLGIIEVGWNVDPRPNLPQ